jgi:hypothetical protein
MLPLDEIRARIDLAGLNGASGTVLAEWLAALAGHTHGVILYDAQARAAGFNPLGAGSPEVAAFNSALSLICRFDSSMTSVQAMAELKPKIARLNAALAAALEAACRHRKSLSAAMQESNAELSRTQEQAFDAFIELTERGAAALIEVGGEPSDRGAAIAIIDAYDALAMVAESIPRLRRMREYLSATMLPSSIDDESSRNRDLVELETECQMLAVALSPGVLAGGGRNLDALEARFHKFKWNYVEQYRSAHDNHRDDLRRLSPVVANAHLHLEALRRLNSIAALGPSLGVELAASMSALEHRLMPCDFDGNLAPEITPCCPRCGYTLGMLSSRDELNDLGERAHRALLTKLTALAQSAIARLIRNSDDNHRLDGFLKIVQAAQTDALINVLDDDLAQYLAKLLNENIAINDVRPGANADVGNGSGSDAPSIDVTEIPAIIDRNSLRIRRHARTKIEERDDGSGRAAKAKRPPDVDR